MSPLPSQMKDILAKLGVTEDDVVAAAKAAGIEAPPEDEPETVVTDEPGTVPADVPAETPPAAPAADVADVLRHLQNAADELGAAKNLLS